MTERTRTPKPQEKPRAGYARSVSDMLPEIGGLAFRRFGFVQSSIVSRWRDIVGERFAGVSTPESIRFPVGRKSDGVLTLLVDGAHAVTMQHVAPNIIERVNRFFGYPAVARVTLRQGAARTPPPPAAPAALKPVPADLGDSLRAIADPELRACLEGLARGLATTEDMPRLAKVKA